MTKIRLLLKDLRQENDLSQEELAQALHVSRQSIISLERGEYLPSSPVLLALMEFFNCPIEKLVDGINLNYSIINQTEKGGEQQMQSLNQFQAIDHFQDDINEMVERTFGRGDWSRNLGSSAGAMNIHENEQEYEIELQAPGYNDNEIAIEVADDTLVISGSKKAEQEKKNGKNLVRREWQQSEFSRSVRFASPIKEDQIDAKLENGTLTIIAPKVEPVKPKIKKITVKKG